MVRVSHRPCPEEGDGARGEEVAPPSLGEHRIDGIKLIKLKMSPDYESGLRGARAVREALGDDARIMMDVNGMWTYDIALMALRRMEKEGVNLELIEQPLPYWDIEGMARLRQKVDTPIFADESAKELQHLKEIIDRQAADGLFLKVQKAGGLIKSQRWLTLARLSGMAVMCGCMPGSGLEASPAAHLLVSDQWASQFVQENCGPLSIHDVFESDGRLDNEVALNGQVIRGNGGTLTIADYSQAGSLDSGLISARLKNLHIVIN